MSGAPIAIFCSYAPADEPSYHELKKHLGLLLHQGRIRLWHQGDIPPGADRATAINTARTNARILLLLISADFFACQECMDHELPQAMTRHYARTAQVIPILLRPVADWQSATFGPLQVLPMNRQPISTWKDPDAAWEQVVEGIILAIDTPFQAVIEEAGPAPGSSLPLVWTVPYQRNPIFTGREEVLAHLEQQLRTGQPMALSQPRAISGLGGIGKTQLAVEYAYRHATDYHAVLWARAESQEALTASFADLATALQLPEQNARDLQITIKAVQAWLHTHSNWLLILDNADDLTVVPPFLPRASRGHILLTTRESTMRKLATRIEMATLTPEVGALFLLRRAGRLAPEESLEQASPVDQQQAKRISHELGGLPLALDQAGAYLEDTRCSLADYLPIYQRRRAELLQDRRDLLAEHPHSVATTVSLAVQRIAERHPAAADLLRLCSFLSPDTIPEELFTQGAAHLGPTLTPVASDPFLLNQTLEALLTASLITRDPDQKTLSVHRLVQAVLRDAMSGEETQQLAERAVLAVNAAFPEGTFETWPACKRCLPSAQECFPFIEQEVVKVSEAAALLTRMGWYLRERGQYTQAEAPSRLALHLREHQLGPDHPDTGQSLNNLALLYWMQSRYAEAQPLCERALAIYEERLGPHHPQTATSLNNLALLYGSQGKYAWAEPLFQQALAIREEHLGPMHPDTANSLNNLAGLYWSQGKYARAELLFQQALAIREKHLGPHHPQTATSLNNLAKLYESQGKYAKTEPPYERALTICEEHLGPMHPDTASSLNNLAGLYESQGKYAQAEPLYERALAIDEKAFGPDHPEVATDLNNLAGLYWSQSKYAQAEPLFQQALAICEEHLGPYHPTTALSLNNLAGLYESQGKYEQAEPLYRRALDIVEERLGLPHPTTLIVRGNYIRLLRTLGRNEEAAEVEARAVGE